ncbi:hypothetical protein [Lysobacter niastensis]|jgi:hypothetical protein|nr:hypothetical protein [Lysobacter niastensis]
MSLSRTPLVLSLALAVATVAACSTAPKAETPTEVAAVQITATGTVTAIDTPNRLVTIRNQQNEEVQVHADETVRNFDQIHVGDIVSIDYKRSVAVDIQPAGSAEAGAYIKEDEDVAKLGEKPRAGMSQTVTVMAPILAIDTANNTITVKGPRGNVVDLDVVRPEQQARLSQLKVGDILRVAFTEAAVVSVRPKGK